MTITQIQKMLHELNKIQTQIMSSMDVRVIHNNPPRFFIAARVYSPGNSDRTEPGSYYSTFYLLKDGSIGKYMNDTDYFDSENDAYNHLDTCGRAMVTRAHEIDQWAGQARTESVEGTLRPDYDESLITPAEARAIALEPIPITVPPAEPEPAMQQAIEGAWTEPGNEVHVDLEPISVEMLIGTSDEQ